MKLELTAQTYRKAVEAIPFGKRLPTAIYVHRGGLEELPILLRKITEQLWAIHDPEKAFNLVKFFRRELKLSLLAYPSFMKDAHPALARSMTINLVTGKVREISYTARSNPPILHRKETFLPPNHARASTFAKLTQSEEQLGLLEETAHIGFQENWHQILRERGVEIVGHTIRQVDQTTTKDTRSGSIPRHLTAIPRREFSKPIKALLSNQLLTQTTTFFDYGCGLGDDLRGLEALDYTVTGWDPHFAPAIQKTQAEVVNMGFVLNVIEDPAERIDALRQAWKFTQRVLCVTVLAAGQEHYQSVRPYQDGILTKRGTFQKYFEQSELLGLIEHGLDVEPIPIGLGMCLAFRRLEDAQDFLSRRTRRAIDWESVSRRLRALRPNQLKLTTYERNPDLLDDFWRTMLTLGRCPKPDEYERSDEVRSLCKSLLKAADLFVQKYGPEELKSATARRKEDLLVYLSAGEFQKRPTPFTRLSKQLRTDIKSFFGDYHSAQTLARELLFASGDPDELELAIDELAFGWRDPVEGHFAFHRSCIPNLPPILRIYIECAARRYGDPEQADIIKVHIRSGKLTFLHYDDFERAPFPQLHLRIKVDLRRLFVTVFDHSLEPPHQLLYFKERFLPLEAPKRKKMEQLSRRVETFGIRLQDLGPNDRFGPSKEDFEAALHAAGLNRALAKRPRT